MIWDESIKNKESRTDIRPILKNSMLDYVVNGRKFKAMAERPREKEANDKLVAE
jgi:hypothetical protein